MRSLILAIQFLTRLPTPQLQRFEQRELASAAPWFPWVGLIVGALVTASLLLGMRIDSWLGALLALLMWVWVTGALHLDGLADLSDALGASHRDPQRFLQVMRDPHIGTFGVVALIMVLLCKFVLLRVGINHANLSLYTLSLICAWARLGAIAWSAWLPSLSSGRAEAFTWRSNKPVIIISAIVLLLLCARLSPALLVSPLILAGWWLYLKLRLRGMTGDCLGAGIELTETALLLVTQCVPVAFSVKSLI